MLRYTLKRLAVGILTLAALATITFFLMKIIPGSPFGGELAQLSPEVREMLYAQYNLDKSIPEQFLIYLQNAVTGDFGDSMTRKGTAVTTIIARCLPATMKLGLVAFIIAITVGVTLGIVAAFTKRKWVENLVMFVATIGISVPSFLYAMLLMIVFGVILGWLPIIGLKTPLHYIMPAFSLALYPISMITRLVRSSMKEVMKQDYIVLARSKGTPMIKVILGHALKNCLIPVVTYAGPLLAFLITGSFVIESLFSIPGIGSEFVNSVTNRDYTMIMALTILFGSFIIIVNILTDLLVAFIDPRVKLEKNYGNNGTHSRPVRTTGQCGKEQRIHRGRTPYLSQ